MICPNCRNEIPDDSMVCDYCGAEFEDIETDEEINSVSDEDAKPQSLETQAPKVSFFKTLLSDKKKLGIFSGIAAAVIVLIVVCCIWIFPGSGTKDGAPLQSNSAIYVENGNLCYINLDTHESYVLYEGAISPEDANLYNFNNVTICESAEKIFFLKDIVPNKDTAEITAELCVDTLYSKKSNPVIIDTKVTAYKTVESGETLLGVLYEKDNSLYEYDAKEGKSTRISSVNSLSDMKIISDDSYAYITTDGALFEKTFGKKEKEVSQKATAFYATGTNGNIAYEKSSSVSLEFKLSDYVDYDIDTKDLPSYEAPKEPSKKGMSEEEYEIAYEEYLSQSSDYNDLIEIANNIEEIKKEIEDAGVYIVELNGSAVYEYDFAANKSKLHSEYGKIYTVEGKLCYFTSLNKVIDSKAKLSEMAGENDVITGIKNYIDSHLSYTCSVFTPSGTSHLSIPGNAIITDTNENATKILYMIPATADRPAADILYTGNLYSANLADGTLSDQTLIDSDVFGGKLPSQTNESNKCDPRFSEGKIAYYKNYINNTLCYYEDKNLTYSDAVFGHVYNKNTSSYAYLKRASYDEEGNLISASLVIRKDGTETEVCKGKIDKFYLMDDGTLVYSVIKDKTHIDIYKYVSRMPELVCENATSFTCTNVLHKSENAESVVLYVKDGILYTFSNGESEQIAEGVTSVSAE